MRSRFSAAAKARAFDNPEPVDERGPSRIAANWEVQEPWMAILIDELNKSFREFAKESSRLTRMVQPKKKCRIPSEGFNLQLAMRVDKVDATFHTYMRRKQELLSYITATAAQGQKRSAMATKTTARGSIREGETEARDLC